MGFGVVVLLFFSDTGSCENCTLSLHDALRVLVIVADGVMWIVRRLLDVKVDRKPYQQAAVITNITPEDGHKNIAYERFTDSGPLALLPLRDNRYSVVWTVNDNQLEKTLAYSDDEFLAALQERFGFKAGRFTKVGSRVSYPLALVESQSLVQGRVGFIGNAAHTVKNGKASCRERV